MDVASERLHVLDGRRGQDAMPEIEDVPRPSASSRQHIVSAGKDALEWP